MLYRILFVCVSLYLCVGQLNAQKKKKISFYELDVIKGLYFQPNTIDPFTGVATEEHANGKKLMEVNIKDGKVNGKVKEWDRAGKKLFEAEYENGVQVAKEEQWYSDGFQKLLVFYENGKPNGTCTEWHQTGGKKSIGEFVQGEEEGEHSWWYPTGSKDQMVNYKNGKEHGKMMAWHENGTQKIDATYENGKLQGDYRLWYSNGQQKSIEKFRDSLHIGEALFWAADGRLIGRDVYKDAGVLKESYNYNSGSLKIGNLSYGQVFNTKSSHFMVEINAEDRISFIDGAEDITYSLDGMLLQLFTFPIGDTDEADEKVIFDSFLQKEEQFIEANIESDIEISQESRQNKNRISYYYWQFVSPSSKLADQKPRTVQSEHYVSFICNDQILSLYSVVTNSDETADIEALLYKIADTFICQEKPIDLNSVRKK